MGEVLAAEHVALGKRVVVKILRRTLVDRPDHVDRMRLEAQALARLTHPNIVAVHDYGRTQDGRPFMVMEQLVGRTLRAELKERGRLPPEEAVGLVQQALAGLGAAHAVGLVHRDVKLDNLFLCGAPGGPRTLKVLDFGIAKVLPEARSAASPAPLAFPTEEGVALGTPRFFAPEQARGEEVDARTDVYSTGLVLYALLAGRGPFDHLHAIYDLALAQAEEVPDPPSKVAGVALPPALERAVLRAIAKQPGDRFSSAAAFSEALGAALAEDAADETVPMPRLEPRPLPPMAAAQRSTPPAPIGRTQALPDAPPIGRTQALPDAPPMGRTQALPDAPLAPTPAAPAALSRSHARRTTPLQPVPPRAVAPTDAARATPTASPPRGLRPAAFAVVVLGTAAVVAALALALFSFVGAAPSSGTASAAEGRR
jgi:serine/threonine-protein kinase